MRSRHLIAPAILLCIAMPAHAVFNSGYEFTSRDDRAVLDFHYSYSLNDSPPAGQGTSGSGIGVFGGFQPFECDDMGIGNLQYFFPSTTIQNWVPGQPLPPYNFDPKLFGSVDVFSKLRFGSALQLSSGLQAIRDRTQPLRFFENQYEPGVPQLGKLATIGSLFRVSGLGRNLELQPQVSPYLIGVFPTSGGGIGQLPGPDVEKPQDDHDADPVKRVGTTGEINEIELDWSFYQSRLRYGGGMTDIDPSDLENLSAGGAAFFDLVAPVYRSYNLEVSVGELNPELAKYVTQFVSIGGRQFTTVTIPVIDYEDGRPPVFADLPQLGYGYQFNPCRGTKTPTDPYFVSTSRGGEGSWGQTTDDQWAIKRVGFTAGNDSAWNLVGSQPAPVVVAVIDTGLDWHHLDFDWANLWNNDGEIPNNGVDDDHNGYVDDMIGWDFLGGHNRPWDFDGHGTLVAGVIAATHNDVGIAGINPHARIMVLKAVNDFGRTRASYIAEAVVYAVDNGAQVINISLGGPTKTTIEQAAIEYAATHGAVVVIASGNEGIELDDYGPGGDQNAITVGATYTDDRAAAFSNFGDSIDIVAPGSDVLSLRARYTDPVFSLDNPDYEIGTNYVGDDKRYLHSNGTSFSAPIVAGAASLLWSKNPSLTGSQIKQMLRMSAEDIEFPGKDKYSGYGMLDARALLQISPDFFVSAQITSVERVGDRLIIAGTADADDFDRAWVEIGAGENPGNWKFAGQKIKIPIRDGQIGTINISELQGADVWQIQLSVEHDNGIVRSAVHTLKLQ